MTVPNDALERHKPIDYHALRPIVRSGDIFLCQGEDAFSGLIRWSTKSAWSHVALAFRVETLDQVVVIEAVEKIGVRAVSLAAFLSRNSAGVSPYPGKILLARNRRLPDDPEDPTVQTMARFCFSRLGSRFAPGEIAKIAFRIADARLFGNRKTPRMLLPDDEFMCSEFVAAAYDRAKLPIPWDGLGFIAPCDIAEDPAVEAVAQADVSKPPQPQGAKRRIDRDASEAEPRPRAA